MPGSAFVEERDVEAMLAIVERGSVADAVAIVRGLLGRKVTQDDIVAHLLVEVQARSGTCWQRDEWSISQEHAATATVEHVLAVLGVTTETTGWRGRVGIACIEREWHTVPGRLLAERLRLRGWSTVFLGQSMPPEHLNRYVANSDLTAMILSCQVSMNLLGAPATIDAVHRAGLPVVLGGRGLGPDDRRARNLGADAWCDSVDELDDLLEQWSVERPPPPSARQQPGAEHLLLLAASPEIVQSVLDELGRVRSEMDDYTEGQLLHARQDVLHVVKFLAAAIICDDERVLTDMLPWMEVVLETRGVDGALVELLVATLDQSLGEHLPTAHRMLAAARATF